MLNLNTTTTKIPKQYSKKQTTEKPTA